MAIFDTDLDYTQLIQFTNGALQLGSFVQIRNALIKRMKDLYGNDIDVSPASADGQLINSWALLFNNIMQTLRKGNDSLDPAVATGQYLDTLCSFNNISRIEPTASSAELYLYNSTNAPIRISKLTFIDKNNTLWVWDNGGKEIEIPVPPAYPYSPGDRPAYLLTGVLCEEIGKVSAPGRSCFLTPEGNETQDPLQQDWADPSLYTQNKNGTIYQCIDQNGLYVWQYKDAQEGENRETDEALRSRRYQMLGASSVTVLEGLKGNLLALSAIRDAHIFNNQATGDSSISLTSPDFLPIADGCQLKGHSIYVSLRYREGVEIEDEMIGKLIYDKLTPGISTSPYKSLIAKKYLTTASIPADWDRAYGRYCTASANASSTWAYDTFYKKTGTEYELLESQPADWATGYANYYVIAQNASTTWSSGTMLVPAESHMLEIVRTDEFSDFVYWKECSYRSPKISISFSVNSKLYDFPADLTSSNAAHTSVEKSIIASVQDLISNAKINEYLTIASVLTAMQQGDIQKNGMPTFFAQAGYFQGDASNALFPANLSYIKYADSDYAFSYSVDSNGLPTGAATLTIG